MFQFPSFAISAYEFSANCQKFILAGFPIRKPPDHDLFSGSPEIIAAIRILLRLSAPGHSPYALSSLATFNRESYQFKKTGHSPYAIVKDRV